MASPWLQGMQFGFDASLRMQQLRSQQAERQMRERAAAEALRMKIEENNLAIQERADMVKAITAAREASSPTITVPMQGQEGIGDMAPPIMKVDNPNPMTQESAAMQFVLPVVAKYRPDKVPDFLEGVALAEYRKKVDDTGPAQIQTITGPDGRQHQVFDPGNKGVRQLVAPAPAVTEVNGEQFYQSGPNRFTRIPKDVGQRQLDMSLHKLAIEHPDLATDVEGKPGMKTISPDRWDELALRKGVTSAVQTTAQKNIMDAHKTVTSLSDLEQTLRPADVGVKGVIGDEIFDTWLPQFGFKTADIERMDNRTKLKALVEGALREVSVDNRFSNQDRADIKEVLPRAGIRESYERSMRTIQVLKKIFSKRAIIDASTIGRPTPPWAANALDKASFIEVSENGLIDDDALIDAVKMGKITNEEAIRLRQSRPKG